MKKNTSQLEKLKEQQDKLTARIQSLEAKTKKEELKKDIRKKVLVGTYYLDQANQNGKLDEIKNIMITYLKRNSDRRLFDLPEIKETVSS